MTDLIWIDIESTGLDPNKCSMLEVAAAKASLSDPFNLAWIHHSVIWFHPGIVKLQDPLIVDMHTKNGLWKECSDENKALDVFEVEDKLLDLIPKIDGGELPVLAGSSVHFDHEFIKVWMPKLNRRLSHRHYDVSSVELFCCSMGMPQLMKPDIHRALSDLLQSVENAKKCASWIERETKVSFSLIP